MSTAGSPHSAADLDDADVVAIDWQVHLANRKASFHQFQGLAGEQSAPGPRRNGGVPAAELEDRPRSPIGLGARDVGRDVHARHERQSGR